MDLVEKLVAEDETIKGSGACLNTAIPLASPTRSGGHPPGDNEDKASDFRIFWDNAYAWHDLTSEPVPLKNILTACKEANHPDRVYIFSSTSKIIRRSRTGNGCIQRAKYQPTEKQMAIQTIGPNKLNQLAHVRFFQNAHNVRLHMKKHADIIRPKFNLVLNLLQTELGGKKIATWSRPQGGYFISFNTMPGCAKKVVQMAADAGVELTKAGATFPYGIDPKDQNIRIAPTYPSLVELKKAMELFIICVQLVSIEKILCSREQKPAELITPLGNKAQIV